MATFLMLALLLGHDAPNVEGWTKIHEAPIEIKLNQPGNTAFLGIVEEYQNPENLNEYVKVIKRHTSLISLRKNPKLDGNTAVILNYNNKQEKDVLERLRKDADVIGYMRWQVVKDSWTGREVLAKPIESWFRGQAGEWVYSSDTSLSRELVSEPSQLKPDKTVLIGVMFSLDGFSQLLRIDQNDIIIENGEEKK